MCLGSRVRDKWIALWIKGCTETVTNKQRSDLKLEGERGVARIYRGPPVTFLRALGLWNGL